MFFEQRYFIRHFGLALLELDLRDDGLELFELLYFGGLVFEVTGDYVGLVERDFVRERAWDGGGTVGGGGDLLVGGFGHLRVLG